MKRLLGEVLPKWQKLGLVNDIIITQSNLKDALQIQDKSHSAIAKYGCTGDAAHFLIDLTEGFNNSLMFANNLIHHKSNAVVLHIDYHHLLNLLDAFIADIEDLAQIDIRHPLASDLHHMPAMGVV